MKLLKSLPAIATILLFHNCSIAQLRPGIEGGVNYSTIEMSNTSIAPDYRFGYHVRGVAEFVLSDVFSLESGIGINTRGYKSHDESTVQVFGFNSVQTNDRNLKLNYLNIPVLIKAGKEFGNSRVYVGVGPDLYYATSGKYKYTTVTTVNGNEQINKSEGSIDFKNDNIQRFDLAAKGILGVEYNGFYLQASYEHGFINLNTDPNVNNDMFNRNFALTLGFKLGGY